LEDLDADGIILKGWNFSSHSSCCEELSLLGYNPRSRVKPTDVSEEHVASIVRFEVRREGAEC
jgi:hypothetical protein